ncbi:MAG: amidohydrolase [Promethearchaeota archaeon]
MKSLRGLFQLGLIVGSILLFIISPALSQVESSTFSLEYADLIFSNANIITINDQTPQAQAIAIKGDKILAIGTNTEILQQYETPDTTVIALEGQTIMPGFIDGHTHLMWSALYSGIQTLASAQQIALSYGYTTLNEKGADIWERDIQPLLDAEQADELILRINIFPVYNLAFLDEESNPIVVERWYPERDPILDHDRMLRVPGIKIYSDGASGGGRGWPALSVNYSQEAIDEWQITNPRGDLYFNQTELNSIVKTIHDKGFSCAFHSMGDRSTETVLNAIEYALDGETNDNYRHQIEHNSFIRQDQITKALQLNTLHSVRGYFPTIWQDDYASLFNEILLEWYVNRYSMPGVGLHSYYESDFTWEVYIEDDVRSSRNINPFLHLWGLVTRSYIDENGTIYRPNPWLAEHGITVEQALKVMTWEGAYAVKQENYLGSLEVGKFADLIILPDNPLTIDPDELKDLEVLVTMVGGNIEFMREGFTFPDTTDTSTQSSTQMSIPTSGWVFTTFLLAIIVIVAKRRQFSKFLSFRSNRLRNKTH